MKAFAHVFLGDKLLLELEFSVGEGGQTFKWFGLAIESRIREHKLLRSTFAQDSIVVLSIENGQGALYDPTDRLHEHCDSEALHVKVRIGEQVGALDVYTI